MLVSGFFRTPVIRRDPPPPGVFLTFDDGPDTNYTEAFAYMHPRNIKGTAYVVTDWIDTATRLSTAQLNEMQDAGWLIGNHSKDHKDMTTLSQADATADMNAAVSALTAAGFKKGARHFCWPGGGYNATALAAFADANLLTGRRIDGGALAPIAGVNKAILPTFAIGPAHSLAELEGDVTTAIAAGNYCCFMFHNIFAFPNEEGITPANFHALIDWIFAQQVPVYTVDEIYAALVMRGL